jgi:hypothetical protein
MEPFEAFQVNGYLLILHTDEICDGINLTYDLEGTCPKLRKFAYGRIFSGTLGDHGCVNEYPITGIEGSSIFN